MEIADNALGKRPSMARPHWVAVILSLFVWGLGSQASRADSDGPPPDIAAKIAALGPVVNGPATAAIYGPLQKGCKDHPAILRDLAYGQDPDNLADVFVPSVPHASAAPVLIFVHGGGYTGGARRLGPDSPFYDNVGQWAACHGFIGINMTYRRAPRGMWPAAADDVGAAVAWVRQNVAQWRGDPDRIFLMGHSAGATHVASYIADPHLWRGPAAPVRGAIIISGSFDVGDPQAAPVEDRPYITKAQSYYGTDASVWPTQSSVPGLVKSDIPLLFVNAAFDPPYFHRQAAMLAAAMGSAQRGRDRFVTLVGHDHMSEVFSINAGDDSLTRQILTFVKDQK